MRHLTLRLNHLQTAAAVVLCMAPLLTKANAQQATAKIVGSITDQQGAVMPGVKVTVTNTATNASSETITDKAGFDQVLNLPIGSYGIVARHEGFRSVEMTTAPLEINQALRADMKLEVGAPNEQVTEESQVSGVETINATLGQSVTSRRASCERWPGSKRCLIPGGKPERVGAVLGGAGETGNGYKAEAPEWRGHRISITADGAGQLVLGGNVVIDLDRQLIGVVRAAPRGEKLARGIRRQSESDRTGLARRLNHCRTSCPEDKWKCPMRSRTGESRENW